MSKSFNFSFYSLGNHQQEDYDPTFNGIVLSTLYDILQPELDMIQNDRIHEIDYSTKKIKAVGAKRLSEALKNNKSLTSLNIESNDITNIGIEFIADFLKCNKFLTELNLSDNSITAEGFGYLSAAIKGNRTLKILNLSNNHYPKIAKGIEMIAVSVAINKTLTVLKLAGNKMKDAGVKNLTNALMFHSVLTGLDLSDNEITSNGASHLLIFLKCNPSLRKLVLSNNKLEDAGAKSIAEALCHNQTLLGLELSNNQIGIIGAEYLAKALKTNSSLEAFGLSGNQINTDGAIYFADLIRVNQTLITLGLSSNKIGVVGAMSLGFALRHNKSLKVLKLLNNKIGIQGANAIIESLKYNSLLEELYLSENQIYPCSFKKMHILIQNENSSLSDEDSVLPEMLKVNTSLKTLVITRNNVGMNIAEAIKEAVRSSNFSLSRLELDDSYNTSLISVMLRNNIINQDIEEILKYLTNKDSIFKSSSSGYGNSFLCFLDQEDSNEAIKKIVKIFFNKLLSIVNINNYQLIINKSASLTLDQVYDFLFFKVKDLIKIYIDPFIKLLISINCEIKRLESYMDENDIHKYNSFLKEDVNIDDLLNHLKIEIIADLGLLGNKRFAESLVQFIKSTNELGFSQSHSKSLKQLQLILSGSDQHTTEVVRSMLEEKQIFLFEKAASILAIKIMKTVANIDQSKLVRVKKAKFEYTSDDVIQKLLLWLQSETAELQHFKTPEILDDLHEFSEMMHHHLAIEEQSSLDAMMGN